MRTNVAKVFFFLILAAMFGGPIWWRRRARHRLAAQLGGRIDGSAVSVTVDGLEVRTRYHDKHGDRGTYVDVPVPPGEPLTMAVVPHGWRDRRAVARGTMIDLATGDEAFDRAYRVEVAPVAIGRELLDDELRAYMMRARDARLYTEDGVLRLAVGGWLTVDETREAVTIMSRAHARVRATHAELAQLAPSAHVGAPHRGLPTDAPALAARAARGDEVDRLDRMLARRTWPEGLHIAGVVAGVIGILVGSLIVLFS